MLRRTGIMTLFYYINKYIKILMVCIGLIFCSSIMLITLIDIINSSDRTIYTMLFNLSYHYLIIYILGVVFSIYAAVFTVQFLMKTKDRNFHTLLSRVMLLTFIGTAFYNLFSLILFPMLIEHRSFFEQVREVKSQVLFFERTGVFSIFLVSSLVYFLIVDIRQKLGRKVLLNFFIGKYRKPIEEYKTLLFLDLKGSTEMAEAIGHYRYTEFLQEFYYDLGLIIEKNKGDVYQYVGDEIVVTWSGDIGVDKSRCIQCYFDISDYVNNKEKHYLEKYGFPPSFRVGIHHGETMAAEIGYLRVVVNYVGDTVNTASRIMGMCDNLNVDMLLSESVLTELSTGGVFKYIYKDEIIPRGKTDAIKVYSAIREK